MFKSDGNGGYNISKASTVTLGIVLVIIGTVTGMAVSWGTQTQLVRDHCTDDAIHWTRDALDDAYMPRGETEAHLAHIDATLQRMEAKIDRLQP